MTFEAVRNGARPGDRRPWFDHRFSGHDKAPEGIELKEAIETGALDRMMQNQPAAGDAGITWTTWQDPDQD